MRRAALLSTRTLVVLCLLAAAADVQLPAASRPRRRIHLVDRSTSVLLGPESSRRPKDADAVVAFDRGSLFASFAGDVRFDSAIVDEPERTDLRGALDAVLGRDPTEIVLHSDGRGDPGPALLLCRARGVPVHVLPLGPQQLRDIRFVRVVAPADAAPAERFDVEAHLESTFDVRARVRLGDELRELALAAGTPAAVVFPGRAAGEHPLSIETQDEVPANNALTVSVLPRTSKRRVLAIPGTRVPDLEDVDLVRAAAPGSLSGVHAVIVDGPTAAPEHRAAIARYVREGGGLLLLGGRPDAFDWAGTPLEEVAPVRARPDHQVAVVFAIDSSGSMEKHLDAVVRAVEETRSVLGDEGLLPMAFSGKVTWLSDWRDLPRRAEGETDFVNALQEAKKKLDPIDVPRKHVLLFTDGVTASKETPAARQEAARALGAAGLTVITIDRELDIARPNVKLQDLAQLAAELQRLFLGIRETWRERPGPVDVHPHPATQGLAAIEPAGLNLASPKPGAQLAATWGRAPAVYPAIAFAQAGHGRSGAIAFAPDAALLSRALAHVARPASGAYRLSVEPPFVRARGPGTSPRLKARANGAEFELLQLRSDLWEGRLPETGPGTIRVELLAGGLASAVRPCPPELEKLGVDLGALERIAAETGGRVLSGSAELAALPPPSAPGTRSGRAFFLLAALAAIFAELAVSTFWKTR